MAQQDGITERTDPCVRKSVRAQAAGWQARRRLQALAKQQSSRQNVLELRRLARTLAEVRTLALSRRLLGCKCSALAGPWLQVGQEEAEYDLDIELMPENLFEWS